MIVCDIMMPELDGYGVLHSLSKHKETSTIPFIFLTAKSEKEDFRKGMELGADDYITKPFDGKELLNAIEARLKKIEALKPDLVFLDIQMPGIDGFEVIRRRTVERMPPVVFLTAFDQFAIRAFEAEALDYLVKPVTEARFSATMKRLMKRLRSTGRSMRAGCRRIE